MAWELNTLKKDFRTLFGKEREAELSLSLESVARRLKYSLFHYRKAFDYIDDVFSELDNPGKLMSKIFAHDQEAELQRFEAEAHVLACIQNLHALTDTFAHVLYFGLNLQSSSATMIKDRDINIYAVRDVLRQEPLFKEQLDNLLAGKDFKYLNALVNVSKHRALVPFQYTVDFTGEDKHGLSFSAFKSHGNAYAKRLVSEVLPVEHKRQAELVVQTGTMLNDWVANRLTRQKRLNC